MAKDPASLRILTGDRPTGPLHLGHYFGTLQNRRPPPGRRRRPDGPRRRLQTIIDRDARRRHARGRRRPAGRPSRRRHRPRPGDDLHPLPVAALNDLLLPFLSLVSVAELSAQPHREGRAREPPASTSIARPDVDLPRPPGRRHPVLQGHPRPGGPRPAAPPRATRLVARRFNARYRPRALPRARRAARRRTGAPRHRRAEYEQEPGNAIALGASADETARLIAEREDRRGAANPLRPVATGPRCPTSSCSSPCASSATRGRRRGDRRRAAARRSSAA